MSQRAGAKILHQAGSPSALNFNLQPAASFQDQFGQLHSFGEIAGVSLCGEDQGDWKEFHCRRATCSLLSKEIIVEFYDMRAAQQASVAGSAWLTPDLRGNSVRKCKG